MILYLKLLSDDDHSAKIEDYDSNRKTIILSNNVAKALWKNKAFEVQVPVLHPFDFNSVCFKLLKI